MMKGDGMGKAMQLISELKGIAEDKGMSVGELVDHCVGMDSSEEPEMADEGEDMPMDEESDKGNPKKLAILIALGKKKRGE